MIRLGVLFALLAGPAAAHGTLPGGHGFAAGFAHPFVATEHLLALLALGILIGRQNTRRPLAGLLAGLIAGFGVGLLALGTLQPLILLSAMVTSSVLAANLRLSDPIVTGGAVIVGLTVGADTDGLTMIAAAGTVTGVFAIVLNAMAAAQFAAPRLNGIPLRIAGSWIAAAALLILAFLLRPVLGIT